MLLDFQVQDIMTPCTAFDGNGQQIDAERLLPIVRIDTETGVCTVNKTDNDGIPIHVAGTIETYTIKYPPPIRVYDANGKILA